MAFTEEVQVLEQQLLDPVMREDEEFLGHVLASDFLEIGQSGRMYDKPIMIKELKAAPGFAGTRTIVDFEAKEVSPELVLAIYRIAETGTARSSLWRKVGLTWELVFHQDTRPSQIEQGISGLQAEVAGCRNPVDYRTA